MPNDQPLEKAQGVGAAALGGGGIGTVIVGLAQLMPEANNLRSFLISVAPALAVGISSTWIWFVNRIKDREERQRRDGTVSELRTELLVVINDPNAPKERREQAKKQLLTLEDKNFQKRIRILEP